MTATDWSRPPTQEEADEQIEAILVRVRPWERVYWWAYYGRRAGGATSVFSLVQIAVAFAIGLTPPPFLLGLALIGVGLFVLSTAAAYLSIRRRLALLTVADSIIARAARPASGK